MGNHFPKQWSKTMKLPQRCLLRSFLTFVFSGSRLTAATQSKKKHAINHWKYPVDLAEQKSEKSCGKSLRDFRKFMQNKEVRTLSEKSKMTKKVSLSQLSNLKKWWFCNVLHTFYRRPCKTQCQICVILVKSTRQKTWKSPIERFMHFTSRSHSWKKLNSSQFPELFFP